VTDKNVVGHPIVKLGSLRVSLSVLQTARSERNDDPAKSMTAESSKSPISLDGQGIQKAILPSQIRNVEINLDLSSFAGALRFVPGRAVDRRSKQELERRIAQELLWGLERHYGVTATQIESPHSDPPDVTFLLDGTPTEMELNELLPPRQRESVAILRQLRYEIVVSHSKSSMIATRGLSYAAILALRTTTRMIPLPTRTRRQLARKDPDEDGLSRGLTVGDWTATNPQRTRK
jgi:hypothetical protein